MSQGSDSRAYPGERASDFNKRMRAEKEAGKSFETTANKIPKIPSKDMVDLKRRAANDKDD